MTRDYSPPPIREFRPVRLAQLKRYLLDEIRTRDMVHAPVRNGLWRLRYGLASRSVVAAIAIGLLVVSVGLLTNRIGTETASAADVQRTIAAGLLTPRTISGTLSVRTRDPGTPPSGQPGCVNCRPIVSVPSKFVIGRDGSYSSITVPASATRRNDIAFNASTGVETSLLTGYLVGVRLYVRATNVDPASPPYSPEARLASWVQRALAARNPRVKNTAFGGRSAWRLTVDFKPGEHLYEEYGARVVIVVDRETGLILQVTQFAFSPDRWTSIETVKDLKIDDPATDQSFSIVRPSGVKEVAHDYGFRRVTREAAAAIVGYKPLLPTNTLGLTLSDLAVAKSTSSRFASVSATAPKGHDVVSARYGNGLGSFTVTTRRGTQSDLAELLGLGGLSTETIDLTGELAGDDALVSTSIVEPGMLVAFHDGLIVLVSALSPNDAVRVARSLKATDR